MTRLAIISTAALFVTASGALAQAVVPDPTLTPGSVRTTNLGEICFSKAPASTATATTTWRSWNRTASRPSRGLSSRSITWCRSNLAAATTSPTYGRSRASRVEPEWNAECKDELENALHAMVCDGLTRYRGRAESHHRRLDRGLAALRRAFVVSTKFYRLRSQTLPFRQFPPASAAAPPQAL